jgi:hypothetical protein
MSSLNASVLQAIKDDYKKRMVWAKGTPIFGRDRDMWRHDPFLSVMRWGRLRGSVIALRVGIRSLSCRTHLRRLRRYQQPPSAPLQQQRQSRSRPRGDSRRRSR